MKYVLMILIFVSFQTNTIAQWERFDGPYGGNTIDLVSFRDSILYCVEESGDVFFMSRDNLRWDFLTHAPDDIVNIDWITVEEDKNLYILGWTANPEYKSQFYRYKPETDSWISIFDSTISHGFLTDYAVSKNGDMFVGNTHGAILRTTDSGQTWTQFYVSNHGEEHSDKTALFIDRSGAVYCNDGEQLHRSSDNGDSWHPVGGKRQLVNYSKYQATNFYILRDTLIVGLDSDGNVIRSSINSLEWNVVYEPTNRRKSTNCLYASTEEILWYNKATENPDDDTPTLYSTDFGDTWLEVDMKNQRMIEFRIAFQNKDLLLGFNYFELIHSSRDFAKTWRLHNDGISRLNPQMIATRDTNIHVETHWFGYRYEPFRQSWTTFQRGAPDYGEQMIIDSKGVLYKRHEYGIAWSTNKGESFNSYIPTDNSDILVDHLDVLVKAEGTSIAYTNDFFATYNIIGFFAAKKIATSQSGRLFGVNADGEYFIINSYEDEIIPKNTTFIQSPIYSVAIDDWKNLIVSCESGVFVSHDDGDSWETLREINEPKFKIIIRDRRYHYYAIDDNSDVYHSYDGGLSWVDLQFENELGSINLTDIVSNDSMLFVTTSGYGLYTYPLPSLTSIQFNQIPSSFEVRELSPNPVNSHLSKYLSFTVSVSRSTEVSYEMYDLNGRKVFSETNKLSSPGEHQVNVVLPAAIRPGTYFLSVQGGTDHVTKKFVVM